MLLVSVALIVTANVLSEFDTGHPKPTSIMYTLDADTGKAAWISLGEAPDAWTGQFLGAQPEQRPFEIVPGMSVPALSGEAPAVALPPPSVILLANPLLEQTSRSLSHESRKS